MEAQARSPLSVDVVTEFPEMIRGFLSESMIGRASRKGAVRFRIVNPRDFTEDKRHTTDDRPYGGGPGMIMMPDPLVRAVESVQEEGTKVLLMTPSGKPFSQADAHRLAQLQVDARTLMSADRRYKFSYQSVIQNPGKTGLRISWPFAGTSRRTERFRRTTGTRWS